MAESKVYNVPVRVGQTWEDCDPRTPAYDRRRGVVVAIDPVQGRAQLVWTKSGRKTWVKLARMREHPRSGWSGYRLVSGANEACDV